MKLLESLAFLPYLYILSTLALCGQTAQTYRLLIQPYALFLPHLFLKLRQGLDMRLDEDLLLGLLNLEN
jgi:hypothetical protein